MKRTIFLLLLSFIFIQSSSAQGFHYGVKGGINFAKVTSDKFDAETKTGIHAGVFGDLSLILLHIQPELLFSQKGYTTDTIDSRFNYIDIPVMVRIKFFPALTFDVGPQYSILLSQNTDINGKSNTSKDNFNTSEWSGAVGLTATIWKVGASARYTFGLSDVYKNTDSRNSVFQLSAFVKF